MNFTTTELGELPFACATFDPADDIIASTPEWRDLSPGSVSFPVRNNRLVIKTRDNDAACAALLDRLLQNLDEVTALLDRDQKRQAAMLATSLRLLAGRRLTSVGTSHDVIDHALAGISARTELAVDVEGRPAYGVNAPEAVALVLVQLAVNAERHARVSAITISQEQSSFQVRWRGQSGFPSIASSRRHDARDRWGLGFARIAADTVGGALYPPADRGDGVVVATFELGLNRLALPLAAIRDGRVHKATRAWDEETGLVPGSEVAGRWVIGESVDAAIEALGGIAVKDGWHSRSASHDTVWVGLPPDDILGRAADVLDGIAHERALWHQVPEPAQSRIFALASLLGGLLGRPLPRVPAQTWNRKYPELCRLFDVPGAPVHLEGTGATDPRIVAMLAAEIGEHLEVAGDELYLHVRRDGGEELLTRPFERRSDGAIRLS